MRFPSIVRIFVACVATGALLGAIAPADAHRRPLTESERALLRAVNATRVSHGVRRVRVSDDLQRGAHHYAAVLLRNDRFAHASLPAGVSENLALVPASSFPARRVVGLWLTSPSHRAALLSPSARRVGLGSATGRFQGFGGMRIAVARFSR